MKKRLAIICQQGLDTFLNWTKYIQGYEVKTFIVKGTQEIEYPIDWADIVWFEWMNHVSIYGSQYKNIIFKDKVIIRCHSYEALSGFQNKINFDSVDTVIYIADHVKDLIEIDKKLGVKEIIIPNGLELDKIEYKERKKGGDIAFLGHINHKKGIMLIPQLAMILPDRIFHIGGEFQDLRYKYYLEHLNLSNIKLYGKIKNINKFFENKSYMLCTSPWESQNMSVMEGMAAGLKPIVHDFPGAEKIYPEKQWRWRTLQECVNLLNQNIHSEIQREYVERFNVKKIAKKIQEVIDD